MRLRLGNKPPVTDEMRQRWHDEAKRRMAEIDALPIEWRALVHEYGWEPVRLLRELGVKRVGHCEHVIRAIRCMGQEDTVLQRLKREHSATQ